VRSDVIVALSLLLVLGLAAGAAGDVEEPSAIVMSIVAPPGDLGGPQKLGSVKRRLYVSIEKQARHLLTKVHPWEEDHRLKLITRSKHEEHWIRPNAGALLGFAFLHRFGPYDASVAGVSRRQLLDETIVPMVRYLTTTHLTGSRPTSDGEPWGSQWQSAHWAHMLGRACWWIWQDLPKECQEGVRKVIGHEADRITVTPPPHQVDGDTKAEENAWNSQVLSVALVLMPEDTRCPAWQEAFRRWALSAFLRPADQTSSLLVDTLILSHEFTGANIHDDFTLENHGRVHPDYMATFILSMGCVVDYAMSGREPPEAASHNCAGIYENLKWFSLPGGGLVYPNGQDWELLRDPEWIYLHALMATRGCDPDAWGLMLPCLDTQDNMQTRSASGTVYLDEEFFFPSTLSDQIYYDAMAWLCLEYGGPIVDAPAQKTGVRRFDSGKLILNRTAHAIHTFSWGARVMAQVVPYRLDRVTSPHPRSGIGHIRVDGEAEELPIAIRAVDVTNDPEGFEVSLELDHGEGVVRAFINIRAASDGTWRMREKLQALREVTTREIVTGLLGVLNNPHWVYERGQRRIVLGDEARVITSCEGAVFEAKGVSEINVDGALRIHGVTPLDVVYRGAKKPERARVTDELYLNYCGELKAWQADEVISEFEVTVSCSDRIGN